MGLGWRMNRARHYMSGIKQNVAVSDTGETAATKKALTATACKVLRAQLVTANPCSAKSAATSLRAATSLAEGTAVSQAGVAESKPWRRGART